MNTNSNTYTVIYTTIVCVLVAAILAFASQVLKPRQEANEKAETISQILTAAKFGEKAEWQKMGNEATIDFYRENISQAILIDADGKVVDRLDKDAAVVYNVSQLKAQNYNLKDPAKSGDILIPVYIFTNGVSVFPVYGAGLWGPVWGYIALERDIETVKGAYFDHESETPGLGGKIKDDPSFREQFEGKVVNVISSTPLSIMKGASAEGRNDAVDAITGATMTSKGLDAAINTWLNAYKQVIIMGQFGYRQEMEYINLQKLAESQREAESNENGEE